MSDPRSSQSAASPARSDRTRAAMQVVRLRLGDRQALLLDLPDDALPLPESLTEAERDVVTLLIQGLSTGDISQLRGRSYRTVANQLASIYRKVGVASRAELVASLGGSSLEHSEDLDLKASED